MAEKGFGTRVAIRADEGSGLDEADLEAVPRPPRRTAAAALQLRLAGHEPLAIDKSAGTAGPESEHRSERLKQHLTVANVLSCMALFVALGGSRLAAGKTRHRRGQGGEHRQGSGDQPETQDGRRSPRAKSRTARSTPSTSAPAR